MRYYKVELKKLFDVLRENLINYEIKELKNSEDVLMLIQELKDPTYFFGTNNKPKDITPYEARSEAKKEIMASRVRQ